MASTYVNDLRLEEIGDGEQSGTWGATTNTNLELIAEAFSYGTEAITTNADTHSTTIEDGATDPGRSLYIKYTGTLDSTCTVSLLPNTVSKLWIIENATSGGFNLSIKQGSGAEIVIPNGDVKVVYSDGVGTGAAIFDALVDLNIATKLTVKNPATSASPATILLQSGDTEVTVDDVLGKIQFQAPDEAGGTDAILVTAEIAAVSEGTFTSANNTTKLSFKTAVSEAASEKMSLSSAGNLTVSGDIFVGDDLALDSDAAILYFGADQDVSLTHVADTGLLLNGTRQLQFNDASQFINAPSATILDINATDEIEINAVLADVNANLDVSGTYTGGGLMTVGNNIVIPNDAYLGSASSTGALQITSAGEVVFAGSATINGNVALGSDASDNITFNGDVVGHVTPNADSAYTLGTDSLRWSDVYTDDAYIGVDGTGTGILYLGTTSAVSSTSAKMYIKFTGGSSRYGIIFRPDNSGLTYYTHFLNDSGALVGGIYWDGSSSTVYLTSSDYRLKENVSDITGAINRVKALKPRRFNWISDDSNTPVDGFLAHEVASVVPEATVGEKDAVKDGEIDPQLMDASKLIPVLTAALQEAVTKIEALESRVAALEMS